MKAIVRDAYGSADVVPRIPVPDDVLVAAAAWAAGVIEPTRT